MTEQEWLECTKPYLMLRHVQDHASKRRLRLFACGLIRNFDFLLKYPSQFEDLQVAEHTAEGLDTRLREPGAWWHDRWVEPLLDQDPQKAANASIDESIRLFTGAAGGDSNWREENEYAVQVIATLVRCVFANPFRPITVEPIWSTWSEGKSTKIAQNIYDDRAFDRLPILADALEEAGCHNAEMLNHCRSEGPHVRGCWVVDLILGKQ